MMTILLTTFITGNALILLLSYLLLVRAKNDLRNIGSGL